MYTWTKIREQGTCVWGSSLRSDPVVVVIVVVAVVSVFYFLSVVSLVYLRFFSLFFFDNFLSRHIRERRRVTTGWVYVCPHQLLGSLSPAPKHLSSSVCCRAAGVGGDGVVAAAEVRCWRGPTTTTRAPLARVRTSHTLVSLAVSSYFTFVFFFCFSLPLSYLR